MTINDYQQEAMRTASGMNYKDNGNVPPMLLNGVMGLNGESGECIDILKKALFQGHELDAVHLAEDGACGRENGGTARSMPGR